MSTTLTLEDRRNTTGVPQTPTLTCDALSRLTSASATGGPANYTESYAYNAATGNLETKGAWTLAYTDPNHPHAVTTAGGNTYAYDANGNQVTRVIGGDSFTLLYDAENRLVEVQKNGLTMAAFAYDGDGKRVKSVIGGETILFVGGHYEVVNGSATKYYFAGAQRIALRKNGTLSYLIGDHLGSTSLVTDAAGNKVSEIRYKAWGEVRHASGAWVTDYTYTGQYSNVDDFGLMYYGARWYDPYITQFSQPDSTIPDQYNTLDWNRYAYVRYNPVKYNDPSGHMVACANDAGFGCEGFGASPKRIFEGDYRDDTDQVEALMLFIYTHPKYNPYQDPLLTGYDLGITSFVIETARLQASTIGVDSSDPWSFDFSALAAAIIPVSLYEVGPYKALQSRSVGDGLDIHHAPQVQAAGIIPGYDSVTGPSIALPRPEHININNANIRGTYNGSPRQLLAKTLSDLRKYTNAPNSALRELLSLWREMFPGVFYK